MDNKSQAYYWLVTLTLIFALGVILLGAYTRLSDAGLGCPDWPGCYGKLIVPKNQTELAKAQQNFPMHPIAVDKAWKEMAHRYVAGFLGLLIAIVVGWSFYRRRKDPSQSLLTPALLLIVVAFQIVLGMWTITLKVMPTVVTAHLIGGMSIAALLAWLRQNAKPSAHIIQNKQLKPWVIVGLILLGLQIFLGAWTSTNYAALACPHFPFCHGSLLPKLDLAKAFSFLHPIGPNYEGGHLAMDARITIQMTHRYGAFLVLLFWLPFSLYLCATKATQRLRSWGWIFLSLVVTQTLLGVINVVKLLPMSSAVSHNGIAALFLITAVAFLYQLTHQR